MSDSACSWPVECRIRKRADYQRCYLEGTRHHTRHFILFAISVPQQAPRFGIAVSRKVGCAVNRNRLKRILREIFRVRRGGFRGLELVCVAKKGAAGVSFWQAQEELAPLLDRLGSRDSAL